MTERKCCIIDASVLLDFIEGGFFDTLFTSPFDFVTSDIVADEISRSYSFEQLTALGLTILELEEDQELEIASLQREHMELSPKDISVYLFAIKYNAFLISGDGPLRDLADIHRIEYHGTLWLLEELIKKDLLSPQDVLPVPCGRCFAKNGGCREQIAND